MRLPEYDHLDALGMAELVSRGEVTAAELLEAALERADRRDPALNSLVARYDEEARARARGPLPDGPLSGVPFVLKDLLAAWKGHPYTCSSRLLDGYVACEDAEIVRRFQAAGLVLFAQSNTPELGVMGVTEPRLRGATRNPWNTDHTPGGSSGGSAAAVAARIVPAAHGNDGDGSLRIPASACGIFALKPSRGRVTLAPAFGEAMGGFATDGVLTRSVRDSAALLDAIDGPALGDPYAAPHKARPFLDEVGAPPRRLRVAITREALFARATHPDCAAAVDAAARLLEDLGHEVVEARPAFSRDALVRAYLVTLAAQVSADVAMAAREVGRRPRPGDLEPETEALAAGGRILSAADLVEARVGLERGSRMVAAFFETHDVLVTPTMARPPVRVGELAARPHERLALRVVARLRSRRVMERLFDGIAARSFDATGNTMLFNQTGQPAMSVPLHWTASGLPVGVQVAARFGEEATLFRLAAQLEAARPWADRAPPMVEATPVSARRARSPARPR